jgi:hypothetical protein
MNNININEPRLEAAVPAVARDGDDVAYVLHARHELQKSLEAQAKACVRYGAKAVRE